MKVINAVKAVVVVLLVFILSGCDQIMAAPRNELIGDDELLPTVAGIIDGQKHVIAEYVGEDFGEKALGDFDGETVVNGALDESNGRKYLEFCYVVQQGMTEEDALSVIERARDLISAEEMAVLEAKLDENRTMMMDAAEDVAKGLRPSQRAAFWKDMQKLVVKSTVLLTAGIVYALVPYAVWWGKSPPPPRYPWPQEWSRPR